MPKNYLKIKSDLLTAPLESWIKITSDLEKFHTFNQSENFDTKNPESKIKFSHSLSC